MSAERRAYIDTSALAKWYLNESGSDEFVNFLQALDVAVISSLTRIEMRSLLSRRRRMGDLDARLESVLFAAFLEDIDRGWLQLYPVDDARFAEAANLISRLAKHPLRTLDALHLAQALHSNTPTIATADQIMAKAAKTLHLQTQTFPQP